MLLTFQKVKSTTKNWSKNLIIAAVNAVLNIIIHLSQFGFTGNPLIDLSTYPPSAEPQKKGLIC